MNSAVPSNKILEESPKVAIGLRGLSFVTEIAAMNCRERRGYVLPTLLLALAFGACADEVRPPDAALGQSLLDAASCTESGTPTCPGEVAPEISLRDFQTQSATFDEMVSLGDYTGKPTVVALLAGW